MFGKEFENFELKLQKIREESQEDFSHAEALFTSEYKTSLEQLFPRDILGVKKYIQWLFIISYVEGESKDASQIFESSLQKWITSLPLSKEKQGRLISNILSSQETNISHISEVWEDMRRNSLFPVLEDLCIEGELWEEEFLAFQKWYEETGSFEKALSSLPDAPKDVLSSHIWLALSQGISEKKKWFQEEYHAELSVLEKQWYNTEPLIFFVSRSYYRVPTRLRKYEHPKKRLRRTFKLALLRLLRLKLWNIDAAIILEKFEEGASFEDYFTLLYKLLDVLSENPDGKEKYTTLNLVEEIEADVYDAEITKEKILSWEKVTASISNLIGDTDAVLENGVLEKILEEGTDFIGDEIHFNHDEKAGIYAEATQAWEEEDEDSIEEDVSKLTPSWAYAALKEQFHELDEKKRQEFLQGNYEGIDEINEELFIIQSKLEKLSRLLWYEE